MAAQKANQQLTKLHNRDLVLRTIFDSDPISRAEIARSTQLTRTTVSDIVASLIEDGLVQEIGTGASSGGKPSILLSLVANSRYRIGLNLAQDKFIGSFVDLRGEIIETVELPVHGSDGEQALSLVYEILDQLLSKPWRPVIGIGVGAPGLINTRDGIIVNAVNLQWQDLPLGAMLSQRYGLPVSVLNDSQATAIGEFVHGGYGAHSNLVVINVRHGIGAGILIDGKLFQGDGGGAGEIGHVPVHGNNLPCRCGRTGCLETVASARAVVQRVQAAINAGQTLTLDDIQRLVDAGDERAIQIIAEAGQSLGEAAGALVGTLNIHNIILTGDLARFDTLWLDAVHKSMQRSALDRMARETHLDLGQLNYRACILGASAHLLLNDYSLLFSSRRLSA